MSKLIIAPFPAVRRRTGSPVFQKEHTGQFGTGRHSALLLGVLSLALSPAYLSGQQSVGVTVTLVDSPFSRGNGKPTPRTPSFALPSMSHGPFTVLVTNGTASGASRVSSAQITLNGLQIFGPSDFNQNVAQLQAIVTLGAAN